MCIEQDLLMQVVEVPFRYDDECLPPDHKNDAVAYIKDFGSNKTCTMKLTVVQLLITDMIEK